MRGYATTNAAQRYEFSNSLMEAMDLLKERNNLDLITRILAFIGLPPAFQNMLDDVLNIDDPFFDYEDKDDDAYFPPPPF